MVSNDALCGRKLGDFILRERIGEGGFAVVYRCEQPGLGREAVIKVLHQRLSASEEVVQRFMREARLASRLDHPYAAHIYAFGVEPEDGLVWIAMEFVHGTSLEKWLQQRGPLPIEQLIPFFEHVAEVVQNAHDHGIVHRDLKPSNVMVIERAGRLLPKLLDFGIAKLVDDAVHIEPGLSDGAPGLAVGSEATLPVPVDAASRNLTQANATLGSPPYMSPEQWRDPLSVGPRSDLYSLGIMAYEALTGRQPFDAPSIAEIGYLHCSAEIPPAGPQFPAGIDGVFQRVLAKDPAERPASVMSLASELRVAVYGSLTSERISQLHMSGVIPVMHLSGSAPAIRITGPLSGHLSGQVPAVTTTPAAGLAAVSLPAAPTAAPRRWPLFAGAAALLIGAVSAYLLVISRPSSQDGDAHAPVAPVSPPAPAGPSPAPVAPREAAPPAPAVSPPVNVEILSTPRGAEVFRLPSETKVGTTPWKAELPSEEGTQVFVIRKAGFTDRRVEINLRTGGTQNVTLQRQVYRPLPPADNGSGRRKGEPVDPFGTGKNGKKRTP